MSNNPNFIGLSAVLVLGGIFALPVVESRSLEAERMVDRHESRIDALERRLAELESDARNPSFAAQQMRRELALLRERVDSLGKGDGRADRKTGTTDPAPATPPGERKDAR